jgi:hypothetical protein
MFLLHSVTAVYVSVRIYRNCTSMCNVTPRVCVMYHVCEYVGICPELSSQHFRLGFIRFSLTKSVWVSDEEPETLTRNPQNLNPKSLTPQNGIAVCGGVIAESQYELHRFTCPPFAPAYASRQHGPGFRVEG